MKLPALLVSALFVPLIAFATPGGVGSSLQKGLVGHWPLTGESEKTGPELITNTNFSQGGDFTQINDNTFDATGVDNAPYWYTGEDYAVGNKFRVSYDIENYVSGSIYARVQVSNAGATNSGNGHYEEEITITTLNATWLDRVDVRGNLFNGRISNLSIKKLQTADATPYDNHGTIYGATSTTGPNGEADGAMSFDGVDNHIKITDDGIFDFGTNNFSLGAWVNGTNKSSWNNIIYHHYSPGFSLLTNQTDGVPRFWLGNTVLNGTTNLLDGDWHHVFVVRNDAVVTIYVDGNEDNSSSTFSGLSGSSTEPLCIGRYCGLSSSYPLDGSLSDVRIYNRALTADEVAQLYNERGKTVITQKPSLETGLVGHWPLNGTSEAWTELTGDAWQNSTAYGRTAGTNYFSQNGNTIEIINTSGSWTGAGKMYTTSEKGKYKIHIKTDLLNGKLKPAFHLYKNGTRVSYTAVQIPTTATFTGNHASGFNYGDKSALGIYEATDIIDLTNAPDFDAIHVALLSESGTSSPYIQFQSTDIFVKQLVTADATPYDNHGKINGAVLSAGPNGEANGATSFDGDALISGTFNDYLRIPHANNLNLNKEITWSTWLKTADMFNDSYGDVGQGIFYKKATPNYGQISPGYSVWNKVSQSYFMLTLGDGTNTEYKTWSYGTTLESYDNEWFLLSISLTSNGTVKFYFNNELKSTQQFTIINFTNGLNASDDLIIGKGDHGTWDGEISDFRIYNRAISPEEVTQLYEEKGKLMGNKVPSLETGLVGHWPLSGGYTNTSVFADITPYDNGGIITGATVTTGMKGESGGAISFDGVDNYINGDGPIAINNSDFTMSMWEWNDEDSPNSWAGLLIGNNYTTGRLLTPSRFLTNDGGVVSVAIGAPVRTWNHIAAVHDLSEKKITTYLNGNIANTSTYTGDLSTTDQKFALGSRYQSNTSSTVFKGSMSDARVYNRALSDDEIKRLYEVR